MSDLSLQNFVSEVLTEVANGVVDANKRFNCGQYEGDKCFRIKGHGHNSDYASTIDFNVDLTVASETNIQGSAKTTASLISVVKASIDADGKHSRVNESTHRISFSVEIGKNIE